MGTCKICGCTDNNCSQCIEKTGEACYWVDCSHEICSRCYFELVELDSEGSKVPFSLILEMSPEDLNFMSEYVSKLETFREHIKRANPNFSSFQQTLVVIKNIDLWIDAKIKKYPLLQEFRTYVLAEMQALRIDRHPEWVYKENNHFKQLK
jgi:hypothetical protein